MKKFVIVLIFAIIAAGTAQVRAFDPEGIKYAPPAPKFTDAERHAELAARRAAVAARMADNSVMVMFSAEPRIYTNDVNYVLRQENNIYYLTALKQANLMLVIRKSGGKVTEAVYLPKSNPKFETWNGKMYSNEDAVRISGILNIIDA